MSKEDNTNIEYIIKETSYLTNNLIDKTYYIAHPDTEKEGKKLLKEFKEVHLLNIIDLYEDYTSLLNSNTIREEDKQQALLNILDYLNKNIKTIDFKKDAYFLDWVKAITSGNGRYKINTNKSKQQQKQYR